MKFRIEVSRAKNQLEQIATQFGLPIVNDSIVLPPAIGEGKISFFSLPNAIRLYLYDINLNVPIALSTSNPADQETYVINTNLSNTVFEKEIAGQPIQMGNNIPSGIFFYSPGTDTTGFTPAGIPFTFILVTFTKQTLANYFADAPDNLAQMIQQESSFCVYEELDALTENQLQKIAQHAVESSIDRMQLHIYVLDILSRFLNKVANKKLIKRYQNLHQQDIEALFRVKQLLMQHVADKPPTIPQIATQIGMSESKLKKSFKQVFDQTIYQFHLASKMQEARNLLASKTLSISDVGYRLGYSNLSHFTDAFRKQFEMTPSEYLSSL